MRLAGVQSRARDRGFQARSRRSQRGPTPMKNNSPHDRESGARRDPGAERSSGGGSRGSTRIIAIAALVVLAGVGVLGATLYASRQRSLADTAGPSTSSNGAQAGSAASLPPSLI